MKRINLKNAGGVRSVAKIGMEKKRHKIIVSIRKPIGKK